MSEQESSSEETGTTVQTTTTMATSIRLPTPVFSGEKKFEQYMLEVEAWSVVCGIAKEDQAVHLALALPANDLTGVKEKLFHDIPLVELHVANGLEKFREFMNSLFKKDDLTMVYERYTQFEQFKREPNQTIEQYILQFDQLYKRAEKKGLVYPEVIKAFKLLDNGTSSSQEKLLSLTAVDFNKKTELYTQMQAALRKFQGEQVYSTGTSSNTTNCTAPIKLEPTFFIENEEALLAAGYVKQNCGTFRSNQRWIFRSQWAWWISRG